MKIINEIDKFNVVKETLAVVLPLCSLDSNLTHQMKRTLILAYVPVVAPFLLHVPSFSLAQVFP